MNQKDAERYVDNLLEIEKVFKNMPKCTQLSLREYIHEIAVKHNLHSEIDMECKIMQYFLATFKSISTNSVLLWRDPNNSWRGEESITAGKYGFGIRGNKQAKPIENMPEVMLLKKHMDEVCKALDERRKWNKSQELKKFFSISYDTKLEKTIKFKKPIKVINQESRYSITEDSMCIADSIYFDYHSSAPSIYLMRNEIKIMSVYIIPKKDSDSVSSTNYGNVLVNFLILDQLDYILKEFEEWVIIEAAKQKEILDKYENEFGRYILSENL